MPVKQDAGGRRYVQAEAEVPGNPEDVWRAIATGPGLSSWFVPSEVDGRMGGEIRLHFGPGSSMDSVARITAWNPPHSLGAVSQDWGPEAPAVATEWTVEARAGGSCTVRVVHSWFADTDDWDNQFEGTESGWSMFFSILRLVLTHFRGQPSAVFQLMAMASEPVSAAWSAFSGRLGLEGAALGQPVATAEGAPGLSGVVERAGPPEHPEVLVRSEAPAPGLVHLFAMPMGGQVFLPIRVFLFGDEAAAVATREQVAWEAWVAQFVASQLGTGIVEHSGEQ